MGFQSRYTPHFSFYIFLAIAAAVVLTSFTINTVLETIILAVFIIVIIVLTKTAWEPAHRGGTNVRLRSLQIASGVVVVSQPWWKPILNLLSKPFLNKLPAPINSPESPSIAVLLFIAFVIFIVNHYTQDKTAMGKHPTPIEKEFPEKSYQDRLKAFCNYFADDIRKIDRENRWNPDAYIPLDAEVEVQSGTKRLRKVTDLLNAIRSDKKSRVFLVLGDPGSGKSVALRKLCLELFLESEKTGKLPLYINLKEWKPQRLWTEENPPTVEELQQFVFDNLIGRGDYYTNEFMRATFDKMLLHGRFFIILDSFDEIPTVLDEQENSWLIDKLSDISHRFLCGATESRGLLASRVFRKPTSKFDAKTTLEIRPLTEEKIINLLKKSLSYNDILVKRIFKDRQEFVPIARNPFTATLISSYAQAHDNSLPQNQAELYASYIDRNLQASMDKIKKNELTKEEVIQCATDISDVMLTDKKLGLEASISELNARLPNYSVEKVIDVLKYARLGRLGSGDEQQFSFVHRRFNEYFVVKRLLEKPQRVPKDAIPSDSRWRDALVLYCEVAQEDEVKQIANFCWAEINQIIKDGLDMRDPRFLRMIHCLRFIKEAFRARVSCIEDFRGDLAVFIHQILENDNQNILLQKIVVDAVGVLRDEDIDTAIIQAISIGDPWINETALRSCRHLPKISHDLKYAIINYINSFDLLKLFRKKDDLLFSLSLSDGFTEVNKFLRWRVRDIYTFTVGFAICWALNIILMPIITACLYLTIVGFKNILSEFSSFRRFISSIFEHRDVIPHIIFNKLYSLQPRMILGIAALFAWSFIIESSPNLYPNDVWGYLRNFSYISLPLLFPIYYIPFYLIPFIKENLMPSIEESSKLLFSLHFLKTISIGLLKFLFTLLLFIFSVSILFFILFFILLLPLAIINYLFILFNNFLLSYSPDLRNLLKSLFLMLPYLLTILFAVIIPSLFGIFIIRQYVHDWQNIKKQIKIVSINRENIEKQLKVFKTSWGRMEYVKFLQHENIKPIGNWSTSNLPNYKDPASSLLARLEEKWLGLDR
ncbi:putative NTPase (NACHT family) [Rivularia sp. PCC 7116]|uniref:NACHT domain-containing protein n=1 Tax=Rivularia sp. PCC 7116 TaxID=373994 RepID=UPI00029F3F40|nr:NACHT domain-containing protein [Rivularia sp. PCC 7116]AFY53473.1 putative NTPase (NACHT family) [Rivularia sp. PCC 7116]